MEIGGGAAQPLNDSGGGVSDGRPEIVYAMVAKGPQDIITEHTKLGDELCQAARKVLPKLNPEEVCKSYVIVGEAFHYKIDEVSGLWFICIAGKTMGRRIPFAFIDAMIEANSSAGKVDAETLKALMGKFNNPDSDKVQRLLTKTNAIHDELMESIDKLMERGELIDLLVQKSEDLSTTSLSFRRETQSLRRVMWWRNVKTQLLIVGLLLLVVFVVVWWSCGIQFESCR